MNYIGRNERFGLAWRRFDWVSPLASTIYTLYMLLMDGVLLIAMIGLAHGVEWALDIIESGKAPVIAGYAIHASTFTRFGDYALFVGFVLIQTARIAKKVWFNEN